MTLTPNEMQNLLQEELRKLLKPSVQIDIDIDWELSYANSTFDQSIVLQIVELLRTLLTPNLERLYIHITALQMHIDYFLNVIDSASLYFTRHNQLHVYLRLAPYDRSEKTYNYASYIEQLVKLVEQLGISNLTLSSDNNKMAIEFGSDNYYKWRIYVVLDFMVENFDYIKQLIVEAHKFAYQYFTGYDLISITLNKIPNEFSIKINDRKTEFESTITFKSYDYFVFEDFLNFFQTGYGGAIMKVDMSLSLTNQMKYSIVIQHEYAESFAYIKDPKQYVGKINKFAIIKVISDILRKDNKKFHQNINIIKKLGLKLKEKNQKYLIEGDPGSEEYISTIINILHDELSQLFVKSDYNKLLFHLVKLLEENCTTLQS